MAPVCAADIVWSGRFPPTYPQNLWVRAATPRLPWVLEAPGRRPPVHQQTVPVKRDTVFSLHRLRFASAQLREHALPLPRTVSCGAQSAPGALSPGRWRHYRPDSASDAYEQLRNAACAAVVQ
jgi:hypothetical protein